jgi:hypothetical protein
VPFTSPSRRALGIFAAGTIGMSTAVLGIPGVAAATQLTATTTVTVPDGTCGVDIVVIGASGGPTTGHLGGLAQRLEIDLNVAPHDTLTFQPGAVGTVTAGGAGGSGSNGGDGGALAAGGGGGSAVLLNDDLVAIAAGGGGAGRDSAGGAYTDVGADYVVDPVHTYRGGNSATSEAVGIGGGTEDSSGTPGNDGVARIGGGGPAGAGGGGGGSFGGGSGASDGAHGAGGGAGGPRYPASAAGDTITDEAATVPGAGSFDYTFEDCVEVAAPDAPSIGVEAGEHSATIYIEPGAQDENDNSTMTYEYKLGTAGWAVLPTTDGNWGPEGHLTGLLNDHEYTVQVRAVSDAGTSDPSEPATFTPYHRLSAPTHVTATPGPSSITISWEPPVGATGVQGYRASALPGTDPQSNSGEIDCKPLDASARSCLIGVPAGKRYSVVVGAFNAGPGEPSAFVVTPVIKAAVVPSSAPKADAPLKTDKGAISSAPAGSKVTLTGSGYLPLSTITLVIYSTPTVLGTVQADANGNFSYAVTVPAGFSGAHSLVASGVGLNGRPRNLRMDVTIAPKAAELAYTGASITGPAVAGLLALVVGAGLLVASRRRTGH